MRVSNINSTQPSSKGYLHKSVYKYINTATHNQAMANKVHNIKEDMVKDHKVGVNLKVIGDQDNKVVGALNNRKVNLLKNHQDQKSQLNYLLQHQLIILNLINRKK